MNPETKLTNEQVKLICSTHNITYTSHQRITTGFSHEVHRLNNDLVLKIFNATIPKVFNAELAMLECDLPFPKPKLVASDDGKLIGRSYVIMSYIPGKSLGMVWHEATDTQRENLVRQISSALQAINTFDPEKLGGDTFTSWPAYLQAQGEELVAVLVSEQKITREEANRSLNTLKSNSKYLVTNQLNSVYWDIHFDNFIVDDNLQLKAVIDLENTERAALDYPLFVIQKQMRDPLKYLHEDYEKYASKADYEKLESWYRKYYPEMFMFDNQAERTNYYLLIDVLRLLRDWSKNKENHDDLKKLTTNSA